MAPEPGVRTRLMRTNTSRPVASSSSVLRKKQSDAAPSASTPDHTSPDKAYDLMKHEFEDRKANLQCQKCGRKGKYKIHGSERSRGLLRIICSEATCKSSVSGTKVIDLLNDNGAKLPKDLGDQTKSNTTSKRRTDSSTSDLPDPQEQLNVVSNSDADEFVTPQGSQDCTNSSIISFLQDQIKTLTALNERLSDQNELQSKQIAELTAQVKKLTDLLTTRHSPPSDKDTQTPAPEPVPVPVQVPTIQERENNSTQKEKVPTPAESIAQSKSKQGTASKPAKKQPAKKPQNDPIKPAMTYIQALEKGAKHSLPNGIAAGIAEATKELEKAGFAPTKAPKRRLTKTITNPDGTVTTSQPAPVILKPEPEAVYFGGIPRGPIGKLRRALRNALPKWAILSISFIGDSVTEILCHKALVQRLIATLKFMKFRHLKNYDPTSAVGDSDDHQNTIQYRGSCYHRWMNASKKTYSEVCKTWYEKQAESLMARYPNISKSKPFPRRNRGDEIEAVTDNTNKEKDDSGNKEKQSSTGQQDKDNAGVVVPAEANNTNNGKNSEEVKANGSENNNSNSNNQPNGKEIEEEEEEVECEEEDDEEDQIQKQGHPAGDHQ